MPNLRDEFGAQYKPLQQANDSPLPQRADNYLRVATDPGTSFYDGFDTTFDTTDKWSSTVGTVTPAVSAGIFTVQAGTTALATSIAQSRPTFPLLGNMFVNPLAVWKVNAGAKTGAYRFFGLGIAQGSPTVAAPIVDGAGFEYSSTTGALSMVIWATGVRTAVTPLTDSTVTAVLAAALADGLSHRYAVYYKTSRVYFEIDTIIVATVSEPTLGTSTLPVLAITVNGASTVSPAAVSTFSFIGVCDTSSNSTSLSDGTFPWRKQQVGADGGQSARHAGTFQLTYSSSFNVASAVTATDIAVITGSATKTLYVTKVIVSAEATASALVDLLLIKRSAADTGGTPVVNTPIPHDSLDAAATGTVTSYTANPGALGAAVGTVRRGYVEAAAAAAVSSPTVIFEFGERGKPITLRGIAQQLAINLAGVTVTGGLFTITYEWYEI